MKITDKILTAIFCVFIFAFGILFIVLPKGEFSENEKRALAAFPSFSVGSILNGKYETDVETYLNDHFPFREKFVASDAYYMLYTGRNGSNGIYKGNDGYLFTKPVKKNKKILEENIEALKAFVEKTKIMSTMMLVPSSGYIMNEQLPKNHENYNDGEIIKEIYDSVSESIRWVDIVSKFEKSKDSGQIYYKTDHHYTTYGAYLAYEEFCNEHGLVPFSEYTVEKYDGFFGTSYSKSALWDGSGDMFEVWSYPSESYVEINNQRHDSLWFDEHLEKMDKYPVFLNGNQPFERIVNPNADGGNILVLKDSFAHAMIPFLAQHYNRIDMVDLRYYFEPVSKLVEENGYGEIFMIYGISTLCENNDIAILQ